jgi:hypothetical protein
MASPPRIRLALRVLARRRAHFAVTAAAAAALMLALAALLGLLGLVIEVVRPSAVAVQGGLLLVLVAYLLVSMPMLGLLAAVVRTLTVVSAVGQRARPDLVAALGGLGLVMLARRARMRRSPLGWLTDPLGSVTGFALGRWVPPPAAGMLDAVLELAGADPAANPSRGAGHVALATVLAGLAALALAWLAGPPWPGIALALLVPLFPLAGAVGAAVRGVLAGARDVCVFERTATAFQDLLRPLHRVLASPASR